MLDGYPSALIIASVIGILCAGLSFFFVLTEMAFTALGELGIKQLLTTQPSEAAALELFVSKRNRIVSLITAGRLIFTSAFVGLLIFIVYLIDPTFRIYAGGLFIILTLLISAYLPACIYRRSPEKVALAAALPIKFFYYATFPLLALFSIPAKLLAKGEDARAVTEDDIAYLIDVSEEQGAIAGEKQQMLSSIFDISDSFVKTVMVPRMDMVAVPSDITKEEFLNIFRQTGYSRIPVYDDSHDKILGIIYVKDILKFSSDWSMADLISELNPPLFVPETKKIIDLLKEFQLSRQQMAVVVDEYGGVAGIVTMEDLLEEIVGEIWDEYDEEDAAQKDILLIDDGRWLVDGRTNIEDFCEALGIDETEEMEFDTVGGLIYSIAGAIPKEGDAYRWKDYTVSIKKMEDNKILSVEFLKNDPQTEELEAEQIK